MAESLRRVAQLHLRVELISGPDEAREIKWACCQGAVTLPWPQAHSILKWIGGDTFMLRPAVEMSRRNSDNLPFLRQLRIFCKLYQMAENREDGDIMPRGSHVPKEGFC